MLLKHIIKHLRTFYIAYEISHLLRFATELVLLVLVATASCRVVAASCPEAAASFRMEAVGFQVAAVSFQARLNPLGVDAAI